jgi:hypothetical protein
MTTSAEVAIGPKPARPISNRRRDRVFFASMAAAIALTIFAGFSPTYYLKGVFGTPALVTLLHIHGAVFTTWVLLFVVQVALVSARRTDIHRRLGLASLVLVPAMVTIGLLAAIGAARRGFTPPGGPPPLVFFVIPVADLVVFTCLVGAALYYRRQSETHKRLMLVAMIGLLTPAIARFPGIAAAGPLAFLGLTDLFLVVCLAYDYLTRGRIQPGFVWGGLFLFLSQPLRLLIGGTSAWQAFAGWLTTYGS